MLGSLQCRWQLQGLTVYCRSVSENNSTCFSLQRLHQSCVRAHHTVKVTTLSWLAALLQCSALCSYCFPTSWDLIYYDSTKNQPSERLSGFIMRQIILVLYDMFRFTFAFSSLCLEWRHTDATVHKITLTHLSKLRPFNNVYFYSPKLQQHLPQRAQHPLLSLDPPLGWGKTKKKKTWGKERATEGEGSTPRRDRVTEI